MMTPHDISVLLHHHGSNAKWPLGQTNAYKSSINWMLAAGILEYADALPHTTERGAALVEMLCATPLPIPAFVDPRDGKQVGGSNA